MDPSRVGGTGFSAAAKPQDDPCPSQRVTPTTCADISPAAESAPNWADITDEIGCPLCEYNLRGLTEPRCPECGYRFAWPEVLDPARRKHPYLFEHHPESRPWSFLRTLWAGWNPRQFWTDLNPAQRVHPRRLVLYWLVVSLAFAVSAFLFTLVDNRLNVLAAINDFLDDDYAILLLFLVWPGLVFCSLLIFRWSMRRAKVSTKHVLRCVIYAHDSVFWASACAIVIWSIYIVLMLADVWPFDRTLVQSVTVAWVLALLAGQLLALFRLYRAYSLYMRFDYVAGMLLCVVVISLLALANLSVLFS